MHDVCHVMGQLSRHVSSTPCRLPQGMGSGCIMRPDSASDDQEPWKLQITDATQRVRVGE